MKIRARAVNAPVIIFKIPAVFGFQVLWIVASIPNLITRTSPSSLSRLFYMLEL